MNIRRLEAFIAVYKSSSLTAASQHLALTKSAVSQAVAQLESELQVSLFIRESRKLIPTSAAHTLFSQVSPLLDQLSQIYRSVSGSDLQMMGTLRIGVPPDLASAYLVACFAEFAKKHPAVFLQLKLGTPLVLGPLLAKNELDFAVIDASEVYEKLFPISTRLLTKERHVLVCGKKYLASRKVDDFSYDAFCREKFIAYTPDAIEIRFWCRHHFKRVPRHLEVSLVVDQVQATKAAILAGFGFGHVPERIIKNEIARADVWVWPTKTPRYENRISIAQLSGKKPTKLEKTATHFIQDYFARNKLQVI